MGALFKVYKSDGITEITNIKSVAFREAVNTGEHLAPGCVSSAGIEVEVFNTRANAVSAGDVVYAYVYDNANNGTLLGKFNCEPRIDTKNSYKFSAYDNALKLEADFSQWLQANQSNFPYTVKQLVQQACTIAGVTLGSSSWPLSSQSVQAFYANGLTCRDILSYAAELAGRFVRCHTDGNIYFDWYAANANSIAPSAGTGVYAYKQDGLTYANYTTTALARVAVHPSGEDDVAYIYPTGVSTGNTLHIKNNLLLTGADASFFNAAAQQVYTAVTAVGSYCPMSVNLFPRENPFRAGDIVSITDAQSVTISAPITGMTISNAAATLVSDGRENYDDTTETAKAITQLASDVVRINKLKVDWADINTAIINYLTANDVTAQNLTIVDANNNVLATFNANGITLGQTDEAHAELDFNSFILKDKDGNTYFAVGDERDANGEVNVTLNYVGNGSTTTFDFIPNLTTSLANTVAVTIDGNVESNFTTTFTQITFATAPADGSEIVITYTTKYALYHYDVGSRLIGSNVGTYSFVAGKNNTASQPYSSVCGGVSNKANGQYSAIGNGLSNETKNKFSYIGGGHNNEATGARSFIGGGSGNQALGVSSSISGGANNVARNAAVVCGGISNKARSSYSAVGGGLGNVAAGDFGSIAGGQDNSISGGSHAMICGGQDNRVEGKYGMAAGHGSLVKRRSAFAFGEYNVEDSQGSDQNSRGDYVEIVGNGTADNARSNARTLDWSGNETLAGGLTLGTPLAIASGGTGAGSKSVAAENLCVMPLGEVFSAIPDNSDINDYYLPGTYKIANNTSAATMTNLPIANAGVLYVRSSTGKAISDSSTYKYLVQEYVTYTGYLYTRKGDSGSGTTVIWGNWGQYLTTASLPPFFTNGFPMDTINNLTTLYNGMPNGAFGVARIASNSTDAPTTGGGIVFTFKSSGNYGAQQTLSDAGIYYRKLYGGTWGAWVKVV